MHRHEPEDYDCPFCRVVAGGESKVNAREDVVLRVDGAKRVAAAIRETYGCHGISMRQHNEPAGNQDVWHFHVHVFPRYEDDDLYRNLLRVRWTTKKERAPYAERLRAYLNE